MSKTGTTTVVSIPPGCCLGPQRAPRLTANPSLVPPSFCWPDRWSFPLLLFWGLFGSRWVCHFLLLLSLCLLHSLPLVILQGLLERLLGLHGVLGRVRGPLHDDRAAVQEQQRHARSVAHQLADGLVLRADQQTVRVAVGNQVLDAIERANYGQNKQQTHTIQNKQKKEMSTIPVRWGPVY